MPESGRPPMKWSCIRISSNPNCSSSSGPTGSGRSDTARWVRIPLAVTRKLTFLAKAEYFDPKKTRWFFRAAGQIPIRRSGGSASERALETARSEVLRKGRLLCLYPEGTRTLDDYVHKGRTGVTRLSRECAVPIIPVGVVGTVDVQPVNSKFMRPFKKVTIRFGQPMEMAPPVNPDDPMVGH